MLTPTDIAQLLLAIKAVTINTQEPFQYTSGMLSPIYCDNRKIISYPTQRSQIIQTFLSLIKQNHLDADVIAGTATAGIPHAAWIADHLNLPMVYVRNQKKAHGKKKNIEGQLQPGQRVLLIEDLISTGQTIINASASLREAGAIVHDCVAIFSYQFPLTQAALSTAHIKTHLLSHFMPLIDTALTEHYLNQEEKAAVLAWQKNPTDWSRQYHKAKTR